MQGIHRVLSLNFSPQLRQNHLPGRSLDSSYLYNLIGTYPPRGSMLHEDTVKNRYSFEKSRNLSCGRECRAFQLPQPFRGKCTLLSRLRRFLPLTSVA